MIAAPAQPLAVVGVTVIVAVTGAAVLLIAVKLGIFPWPVADRPIDGVLFVQLKIVPATVPVKFTAAVGDPLHNVWFAIAATFAVGLTVIVNVIGRPVQPLATGVTVIVAVTAATPALIAVKLAMLPDPDAANPIDGVLFVQLNVVPAVRLVKFTAAVAVLLHTTWFAGGFTTGVGLTVIVNVIGVPVQVVPPLVYVGVTVIVAVTGFAVAFVATKLAILPVPDAARPMLVLLFVQLYTVPATAPVKVTAVVLAPLHNV